MASYTSEPEQRWLVRILRNRTTELSMLIKLFFVLMICLFASLTQSCAQVDVKRMTYNALRQHDCRVNEPNTFCERGFSNEFHEYERMRERFLADENEDEPQAQLNNLSDKPAYFIQ